MELQKKGQKTIIILAMLASLATHAQETYRKGEVIVKFKDVPALAENETQPTSRRAVKPLQKQGQILGVQTLDALLQQIGTTEVKPLMPLTGKNVLAKRRKLAHRQGGTGDLSKDLSQLCVLRFDSAHAVKDVVAQLQSLDNVVYAEPNYIVKACADYSSEPLYQEQWGLQAIKMPELWQVPVKNTRRPVIAILDSGVETTHPDLAANIWHNEDEAEDGNDSDENGFVDDICGWNFIENNANVEDDFGHGTHCAGIAAAVGGNNEGICGANPDALIMPVKVLDSGGGGTIEWLVQGLDYAVANGADIISMSLESSELSEAEEDVLRMAYDYAVLLAAAGNDHVCMNSDHQNFHGWNEAFFPGYCPRYPAASKYVLGVMATNEAGELASFSNFDCDGPLRALNPLVYGENLEENQSYELKAPGENILSTYLSGSYTYLSGTSMACPMAAGAISRLLQCRDYSHEELLKALTYTSGATIDLIAAYQVTENELSQTQFTIEHKGVTMTFVKINESTCQLGDGEQPAIDVSTTGAVIVPEEVHGLSVTRIAANAFKGCEQVTEVELPFNVTEIWFDAFKGCSSLAKLSLTGWTQTCFGEVFDEATYEKCLLCINDRYIDYYQLSDPWMHFKHQEQLPYQLERVFFAEVDGVQYPFVVTSVSPKTVKFATIFDDEVTLLVDSVEIPSEIKGYKVTAISTNAFIGNKNLVYVKIPSTIETIGDAAFLGCTKLQDIKIPEGVTAVSNMMFQECSALTTISLPSSIDYIGFQAFDGSGITSFTFPKKVTSIEHHLFCGCKNLKHIEIPSLIKRIDHDAFHDAGLETVVIGSGVEYIDAFAFYGCESLKQIEVRATTPPTFYYLSTFPDYSIPLKVPKGCKEIYETAINWELFKNISEVEEPAMLPGDANGDGKVTITDAVYVVNYVLQQPAADFNEAAADLNGDGNITITDAVMIVNIILGSSGIAD